MRKISPNALLYCIWGYLLGGVGRLRSFGGTAD